MRPIVGPSHRHLLVASMLGGGIFVVLADLLARTVLSPVEIPVGLITALIGGPVFLWLLSRKTSSDA
jgi:iron complex transport system permease protein